MKFKRLTTIAARRPGLARGVAVVTAGVVTLSLVGCVVDGFAATEPTASGQSLYGGAQATNVHVNGQHLNDDEWVAMSNALGQPVAPGSYWLDTSTGWAGYAGNPAPVVNVFTRATGPGYSGSAWGGSPADAWLRGGEWNGRMSSGTVAPSGDPYSSVYSVGGEVLTLP